MKALLPARFEGLVFAAMLSGLMSGIVTAVATFRGMGLTHAAGLKFAVSWPVSWMIAFPVVFIIAPPVRRLARAITSTSGD